MRRSGRRAWGLDLIASEGTRAGPPRFRALSLADHAAATLTHACQRRYIPCPCPRHLLHSGSRFVIQMPPIGEVRDLVLVAVEQAIQVGMGPVHQIPALADEVLTVVQERARGRSVTETQGVGRAAAGAGPG